MSYCTCTCTKVLSYVVVQLQRTVSFTKIKRLSILRVVVLYSTEVLSYYRTKVLSYNVVHVRKYESTFEDCTSGIVRTSLAYSTIINRYSTSYLRKGVRIYFRKYFRKCGDTYGSTEVHPYSGLASQFIVHVLYKKCPSRLGLGTCTRYSCSLFTFVVCIKVSIRLAHTGIWSVITPAECSGVETEKNVGTRRTNPPRVASRPARNERLLPSRPYRSGPYQPGPERFRLARTSNGGRSRHSTSSNILCSVKVNPWYTYTYTYVYSKSKGKS